MTSGVIGQCKRQRLGGTVALVALLGPGAGAAQQANGDEALPSNRIPMEIYRLSEPIEFDGRVDEPVWDEIEPVPLIMFAPTWGGELSEETEVRLAYDDSYLYMSGRMFDDDPDGIRLNTFYRDQFSGDDLLSISIDSYNDYETALWFTTNPSGARTDRTVSNDAEGGGGGGMFGGAMNSDWNAHWDVATSRDERGWYAEFRIPFSTLGFQDQGGEVTMGVIIYRFIGRRNERQLFPAISQEWGGFSFAKPSQAQRVRLRGVHPSKPVYVTPYLLGGLDQIPTLQEGTGGAPGVWTREDDPTTEAGLDLKYSPTSNLSLDLTVNTDFAQVEADDQQINLTRFPLFFPEKRQFFQERASTFDFSTGSGSDRLFFSRRIGLNDGELTRIYGGARMVGRLGGLDFGFLNMQTAPVGDRSGENMGVLRLNQQVFNPYSSIGGMVTSRIGSDGQDNIAYGLDTDVRLFGDEYVTLKWAQTFDEAVEEGSALDAGLIRARWERRRDEGFSYQGEYGRVGPDYLPRLGFQSREDFSYYGGRLAYAWFGGATSPFRSVTLSSSTGHYYRNADDSAESRSFRPSVRFEFKNGSSISVNEESSYESIRDTFDVADVPVLPGDYWFHDVSASYSMSRNGLFRGTVRGSAGSFYDGARYGASVDPTWNPNKYLELGGRYEINRLEFGDRDLSATTHLARLKIQIALNTHVSLNTFAQYNSVADLTSINARFRYHFREGTDLWVVYTEGFNVERDNGFDPRLPLSAGRQLMVKYTHTFIW